MKIKKVNESKLPIKSGWYWVLIDGYDTPTPCWYNAPNPDDQDDDGYFLPVRMGDSSDSGLYENDIEKVGPEIIEPIF